MIQEMRQMHRWLLAGALVFLASVAASAQTAYDLQPVARQGQAVGGQAIGAEATFMVGSLNDAGQLVLTAGAARGGRLLLASTNRQLELLAAPGGSAPEGRWPS